MPPKKTAAAKQDNEKGALAKKKETAKKGKEDEAKKKPGENARKANAAKAGGATTAKAKADPKGAVEVEAEKKNGSKVTAVASSKSKAGEPEGLGTGSMSKDPGGYDVGRDSKTREADGIKADASVKIEDDGTFNVNTDKLSPTSVEKETKDKAGSLDTTVENKADAAKTTDRQAFGSVSTAAPTESGTVVTSMASKKTSDKDDIAVQEPAVIIKSDGVKELIAKVSSLESDVKATVSGEGEADDGAVGKAGVQLSSEVGTAEAGVQEPITVTATHAGMKEPTDDAQTSAGSQESKQISLTPEDVQVVQQGSPTLAAGAGAAKEAASTPTGPQETASAATDQSKSKFTDIEVTVDQSTKSPDDVDEAMAEHSQSGAEEKTRHGNRTSKEDVHAIEKEGRDAIKNIPSRIQTVKELLRTENFHKSHISDMFQDLSNYTPPTPTPFFMAAPEVREGAEEDQGHGGEHELPKNPNLAEMFRSLRPLITQLDTDVGVLRMMLSSRMSSLKEEQIEDEKFTEQMIIVMSILTRVEDFAKKEFEAWSQYNLIRNEVVSKLSPAKKNLHQAVYDLDSKYILHLRSTARRLVEVYT